MGDVIYYILLAISGIFALGFVMEHWEDLRVMLGVLIVMGFAYWLGGAGAVIGTAIVGGLILLEIDSHSKRSK